MASLIRENAPQPNELPTSDELAGGHQLAAQLAGGLATEATVEKFNNQLELNETLIAKGSAVIKGAMAKLPPTSKEISRPIDWWQKTLTLDEQIADPSRQSVVLYPIDYPQNHPSENTRLVGQTTEHDALVELRDFLHHARASANSFYSKRETTQPMVMKQAESMAENITFIGETEHLHAIETMAASWKSYLAQDQNNLLCVTAEIGNLPRYKELSTTKSDAYLRDEILSTFSKEELASYGKRIVGTIDDLPAEEAAVDHTKILLVDDRILKGGQLGSVADYLYQNPRFGQYVAQGRVEIQVIAAAAEWRASGIPVQTADTALAIPVQACYEAKSVPGDIRNNRQFKSTGHITSFASTSNYGFEVTLRDIQRFVKSRTNQTIPLPRLALKSQRCRQGTPLQFSFTPSGIQETQIGLHKS